MNIEKIRLEKAEADDFGEIEKIYIEAFPACERKPFGVILTHNETGRGSLEKITLDGKICGFFFTFFYDDLAMVDYFAIREDCRGKGIGEAAIALLGAEYADKRIFLEIEDPESSEMAARRLGFYSRCGFRQARVYVTLFGVDMELLTLGEFDIDFETYFALYTSMLGEKRAGRNVLER